MTEELKLNLTDDQPDVLPPIQLTPEMQAELNSDPMQPTDGAMPGQSGVTVEEVAHFLKLAYQAHGWGTTWVAQQKFPGAPSFQDIWLETDEFYAEVAAGIYPQVVAWLSRFPAAEMAVKAANATGFWGKLAWSYFSRWVVTYLRFRQLNAAKTTEGGGEVHEHTGHVRVAKDATQRTSQSTDSGSPDKRFVVDYPSA